jgi:hypothetical protein
MVEALERSSENIARAALLWTEFCNTFFTSQNRVVPDLPLFVEIQEGLDDHGHGSLGRWIRKIQRKLRKGLNIFLVKGFNQTEENYRVSVG